MTALDALLSTLHRLNGVASDYPPRNMRRASSTAETYGRMTSATLDTCVGFAAVETSRGHLCHWARLDKAGRFVDYEMLTPTGWNFHAAGPFTAALRGARIDADDIACLRR